MDATSLLARAGRRASIVVLVAVFGASAVAPAGAAETVRSHGTVGAWTLTDTIAAPAARCRYQGAAGTWYLDRVVSHGPTVYGTTSGRRSVGYRLLLQHRTASGWKTTQRGPLISGTATAMSPVTLPDSRVVRDVAKSPNSGRYRAAIKLIWWNKTAKVQGVVIARIQHARRSYDGSVGQICRGRLPIAH